MKRREFIAIASSAAVSWTHTTYAQRSKVPTLGVLVPGTPDPGAFWRVLREGLRDFGYVDGQTVRFEFRSAEGKADMLSQLAAELTSMKVDLIITYQTPAAIAAKQATREIPIVMAPAGDPVGTGLVASLAQPGGNVTGLSGTNAELGGKNLELLREILPSMHRVAVLANAVDPFSRPFVEQLQIAARSISVDLRIFMITRPDELDASLTQASRDGADAIIVQPSLSRRRAAELALKLRLPTISPTRSFTEEGGAVIVLGKQRRPVQKGGVVRRQNFEGQQACRLADPAADQVRTGGQPEDSQGAWTDDSTIRCCTGRRGDRIGVA